ncbi:MAG: restriction endonuclease [Gemmatimonadota bacterium]|nr:restriction endonuclease [Gemmatimonadota bacterium]
MQQGPATLVSDLLVTYPLDLEPKRLRDVIASFVVDRGWASHPNFAAERGEEWERRVERMLCKALNELKGNGRPTRIAFNSSDSSLVQGACFIEPNDSASVAEQKRRRIRSDSLVHMIRQLSPAEFELLCRRLLAILGVSTPYLTRRTADEGIDFYGRLDGEIVFFPRDSEPTLQRQLSIWVVGQAKHFVGGQVGTREVRDLVGAIALVRSGVYSTNTPAFAELRLRPHDAVFAVLVTGGTLSARAWTLLRRSGVVGVDGALLAAFLADRGAPVGSTDLLRFRRWLREPLGAEQSNEQ